MTLEMVVYVVALFVVVMYFISPLGPYTKPRR